MKRNTLFEDLINMTIGFVLGMCVLGTLVVLSDNHFKRSAVEAGIAEFYTDTYGRTRFRWLTLDEQIEKDWQDTTASNIAEPAASR